MSTKKAILFVDDDRLILDGLRRMLRPMRKEWQVQFADSGAAALEALHETHFDVIVSDMRMPGMDGAELLAAVKKHHPLTVRIILSGFTEIGQTMRAVGVAHQFLSKPTCSETLKAVIQRALRLRERLNEEPLRALIGTIDGLPALPETYRCLRDALTTEDVDLDQVAGIVERDASLTSKLLQLVNSSLFGLAQPVSSMQQATAFLGTTLLRDLTLTTETFRTFESFTYPRGFLLSREMAHATLTAQIAREVAGGRGAGDEAFLAGMLHDIGILVMATKLPEVFEKTYELAERGDQERCDVERQACGTTHAEIGAYLLGLWGLPDSIVEAIAFHHEPTALAHDDAGLIEFVHIASALADELDHDAETSFWNLRNSSLDLAHLEALGLADKLDGWRTMARTRFNHDTHAA
jgi:HD-like signal output (HDOD) protein